MGDIPRLGVGLPRKTEPSYREIRVRGVLMKKIEAIIQPFKLTR